MTGPVPVLKTLNKMSHSNYENTSMDYNVSSVESLQSETAEEIHPQRPVVKLEH